MAMQAERASKQTVLTFGLASAPVALYKATGEDPAEPKFETAGPNGKRLKTELREAPAEPAAAGDDPTENAPRPAGSEVDAARAVLEQYQAERRNAQAESVPVLVEDADGEPVGAEDVRRGVFRGEEFVDLTDALREVDEKTRLDRLDVVAFIRRERVPLHRIVGAYYVGANGPGAAPLLGVLHQAMRGTGRYAVVKWVKTRRQAMGVLLPRRIDGAQVLEVVELEWAAASRQPPAAADLSAVEFPAAAEWAAEELIEAMADSPVALDEMQDDAVRLKAELYERAVLGEFDGFEVPERPEPESGTVVDLTAVFRASAKRAQDFTSAA